MTQRVFDTDNTEDMAYLWDLLPDEITKLTPTDTFCITSDTYTFRGGIIKIDFHNKREITRPIQEATEEDIGKLCKFWTGKDFAIGILEIVGDNSSLDVYCMKDGKSGIWFVHCCRLTQTEIEELC